MCLLQLLLRIQSHTPCYAPPPPPGSYTYILDLQALERAGPPELGYLPPELQCISSPLSEQLPWCRQALAGHPDQTFAQYVLNGIENFHVGFGHDSHLVSVPRNMRSAILHPSVITSYIATELRKGRMVGHFPPGSVPGLHINRMGVVPKGHAPVGGGSSLISPTQKGGASTKASKQSSAHSAIRWWRQ